MNKIIKNDLLQNKDNHFGIDEIENYLVKSLKNVSDEYDQRQEYGLCKGDSENARDHLLSMLNKVYQKGNMDEIEKYKKAIRKDLSNWFNCIDIYEYDNVLPDIFCIMVRLGYGEVVCEQVEKKYQSFEAMQDDECSNDLWIPDFGERYLEYGDYCLFSLGDIVLARRFLSIGNM